MDWKLEETHPEYGKVVMMGCIEGESYRWFDDGDGGIAMIPLDVLQDQEEK